MVPPFRNITYRLFTFLIYKLDPDFSPTGQTRVKALEAFQNLAEALRQQVIEQDSNLIFAAFIKEARQTEKTDDFSKFISNPSNLIQNPVNMPADLLLPSPDQQSQGVKENIMSAFFNLLRVLGIEKDINELTKD
jgi:hypothetical protein